MQKVYIWLVIIWFYCEDTDTSGPRARSKEEFFSCEYKSMVAKPGDKEKVLEMIPLVRVSVLLFESFTSRTGKSTFFTSQSGILPTTIQK